VPKCHFVKSDVSPNEHFPTQRDEVNQGILKGEVPLYC
jgi:hypothetical protein